MKKVEILSPAGNKEMLLAAVNNGADAIYLAGKLYGARKYANNFDNEELVKAIKYCHIYGVKVYVTINTLIYEEEINEFIKYVEFLYQNNVDAVIMQDLGMIHLVKEKFPDLVIHASTQMHNHNAEGIKYLKDIGVTRVVLARELTLDEVNNINVDIEKEIFVYGALCISYSGQCLLSSTVLNRSGNRGECAGLCRLPYELYQDDKLIKTDGSYLLSPKELNTLSRLREIINSNVDSLKIEGRMKSPEYVGYVTKVFRRLVDCYYNNEEMNVYEEELTNLKKLYNRDFTLGHAFLDKNYKLMNIKSPNHIGTKLGIAKPLNKKIQITLEDDIAQGDGVRFINHEGMIINYLYDTNNLLINKASKGQTVYVDNKVNLKKDGEVLKTYDVLLKEKINDIPDRKIKVNIEVECKIGSPLKATITDFKNTVTKTLGEVQKSINAPVKIDEIVERFSKTSDTPFSVQDINVICDDNIFIPVRTMNDLRRELFFSLEQKRVEYKEKIIKEETKNNLKVDLTQSINILVANEEQLKYLLDKNVNIYVKDIILYKKYKQDNVYYVTPRVLYKSPELKKENILASNLSSVIKYTSNNNVFSDIYLNVTNSKTVYTLHKLGVKKICLSTELTKERIKELINSYQEKYGFLPNIDLVVYGKIEVMLMKHCLLNMFLNKDVTCNVCKDNHQYYLKDRNNELFEIVNQGCNTYLLSNKKINLLNNLNYYKSIGINNFTINLFDESIEDIKKILQTI